MPREEKSADAGAAKGGADALLAVEGVVDARNVNLGALLAMHGHADLLDQVREEDRDNLWVTQIQAPGKYFHLFFLPYTAYAELKDVSEEDGEMEVRNFLKYVDTGEMWPRCIRAYGVSTLRKLQGYAYAVSYDDMIIMLKHMLKKTPKPAAQVLPNSDSAASASSAAEQMPRAPRPAAQAVPAAKQSEDEWSPLDMKDTVAKLSDAVKDLAKVLSSVTKENIRMAERRDSEELRKVKRERDEAIDETEQLRRDLLVKANKLQTLEDRAAVELHKDLLAKANQRKESEERAADSEKLQRDLVVKPNQRKESEGHECKPRRRSARLQGLSPWRSWN
jgi:hypothetical protein